MSRLLTKVRTALSLGVPSLARFFFYKLGVRFGINPVRRISSHVKEGVFYAKPGLKKDLKLPESTTWSVGHDYFHWFHVGESSVPDWFKSPITGKSIEGVNRKWWCIPDFDSNVGDVKAIWEASRFDWVLTFSKKASNGDFDCLHKLNEWLLDWVKNNQPYAGPNWKCGQEASIRVMHLAMAALFLGQERTPTKALVDLVRAHLKRIAPTIQYAIAQNNNHGTSEAAALFIGGAWLALAGDSDGVVWARQGRKWLENRARALILDDGSFSQYSVTYHRFMVDTFSFSEVWRRRLGLSDFSPELCRRVRLATDWLYQMVQNENGDAPNTGANDGALLMFWGVGEYRDFRPSVQLASALFLDRCAFEGDGDWNSPLAWFCLNKPAQRVEPATSRFFGDGGFSVLRDKRSFVLLRFPKFRFRPSQADSLHVDFWFDGQNLLRDGGTYSYNTDLGLINYFSGVEGHNTIQFDGQEQMPRLSRFLFGDWLKATEVGFEDGSQRKCAWAAYAARSGATHRRSVELQSRCLLIEDDCSGFSNSAVLRWRLKPGAWSIDGDSVKLDEHTLRITSTVPVKRFELRAGFESRYYFKLEQVPVLEVEIAEPGVICTEYKF